MNVFTFSGNLGKDAQVRQVGGSTVANFSVAVKSGYGDKEQTNWVDCALWGKLAESRLVDYLTKGQGVMVSGELGTREHDGKTYLTCRVGSINLSGGKSDAQPSSPRTPEPQPQRRAAHGPVPDIDDDIPF